VGELREVEGSRSRRQRQIRGAAAAEADEVQDEEEEDRFEEEKRAGKRRKGEVCSQGGSRTKWTSRLVTTGLVWTTR